MVLQLLPRLTATSKPLSLWRTRAVFACEQTSGDASADGGIVEMDIQSGDLHVCEGGCVVLTDL